MLGSDVVVTALSRAVGVTRQTVYHWRAKGERAVEAVFAPVRPAPVATPDLTRSILATLVAGHASDRGIQDCLAAEGRTVSLGTVAGVVQEAERRVLLAMARSVAGGPCVLALDEIYGNSRHAAYLSVVDARSGTVWAAAGPVAVDGASWTLLLWEVQARGLRWADTVSDGGLAMQQACAVVDPEGQHKRDAWLDPPGASEAELRRRTLTTLYNERPTWLDLVHRRLDQAVFDAYGWPHDLVDDAILARLLALNLGRAAIQGATPPVTVEDAKSE